MEGAPGSAGALLDGERARGKSEADGGMRVWTFRFFDHWCSLQKLGLFAMDSAALLLGFFIGSTLAERLWREVGISADFWPSALSLIVSVQLGLYLADLYDLDAVRFPQRQSARLLRALCFGLLCFASFAFALVESPRLVPLAAGALVGALLLFSERATMKLWLCRPSRLLIVGDTARAEKFCRLIRGHHQFDRVAALDWRALPVYLSEGEPAPATIGDAERILASSPIENELLCHGARQEASGQPRAFDIVVLCVDEASRGPSARTLLELKLSGVPVFEAASFIERTQRRLPVELLRADELVFARGFAQGRLDRLLRRALDLAASIALLIFALPIIGIAALCICLDSKGPVFYRQERVGQGGRPFCLTKLRTMRVDAERDGGPQWARVGDSRVTRVGRILRKCRVDELPQIFSVLRGEMSFVGPRPERAFFVEELERRIPFYRLRLLVKPGITGWAQVRYPYGASVEDARAKLEYDLYYLKNRSLFLDLTILFHTVRHVLMGKGAR